MECHTTQPPLVVLFIHCLLVLLHCYCFSSNTIGSPLLLQLSISATALVCLKQFSSSTLGSPCVLLLEPPYSQCSQCISKARVQPQLCSVVAWWGYMEDIWGGAHHPYSCPWTKSLGWNHLGVRVTGREGVKDQVSAWCQNYTVSTRVIDSTRLIVFPVPQTGTVSKRPLQTRQYSVMCTRFSSTS